MEETGAGETRRRGSTPRMRPCPSRLSAPAWSPLLPDQGHVLGDDGALALVLLVDSLLRPDLFYLLQDGDDEVGHEEEARAAGGDAVRGHEQVVDKVGDRRHEGDRDAARCGGCEEEPPQLVERDGAGGDPDHLAVDLRHVRGGDLRAGAAVKDVAHHRDDAHEQRHEGKVPGGRVDQRRERQGRELLDERRRDARCLQRLDAVRVRGDLQVALRVLGLDELDSRSAEPHRLGAAPCAHLEGRLAVAIVPQVELQLDARDEDAPADEQEKDGGKRQLRRDREQALAHERLGLGEVGQEAVDYVERKEEAQPLPEAIVVDLHGEVLDDGRDRDVRPRRPQHKVVKGKGVRLKLNRLCDAQDGDEDKYDDVPEDLEVHHPVGVLLLLLDVLRHGGEQVHAPEIELGGRVHGRDGDVCQDDGGDANDADVCRDLRGGLEELLYRPRRRAKVAVGGELEAQRVHAGSRDERPAAHDDEHGHRDERPVEDLPPKEPPLLRHEARRLRGARLFSTGC
mmetsp:Transcript_5431/g.13238  ORF Transcript_5431/g.13238 Transcript_5431/m.13238 type:complete len:511 (+) Transcript_5431:1237-2769(+)